MKNPNKFVLRILHLFHNSTIRRFFKKDFLQNFHFLVSSASIYYYCTMLTSSMGFILSFSETKILNDCILYLKMVLMFGVIVMLSVFIFDLRTCSKLEPCLRGFLYGCASCFCYHYNISTRTIATY